MFPKPAMKLGNMTRPGRTRNMRIRIPHSLQNGLIRITTTLGVLLAIIGGAQAQSTPEGAALFGARCFSCHNIGGGDKTVSYYVKGPVVASFRRP